MGRFTEIKHVGENSGINRFELISDSEEEISEEIFFLAAKKGWGLTELYRKAANLEDVFLDLTTRENQ